MNDAGRKATKSDSELSFHEIDTATFDMEPTDQIEVKYLNPRFVVDLSSQIDREVECATTTARWLKVQPTPLPAAANLTIISASLEEENAGPDHPTFKKLTLREMGIKRVEPEDWSDVLLPPKTDLLTLTQKLLIENQIPNVKVEVGSVCFDCYMSLLQAHSGWFKDSGFQAHVKLPSKKITPFAFGKIYEWMLKGKLSVPGKNILEVFSAAFYLRVEDLIAKCWQWIDEATKFGEETAILLYLEARKSTVDDVKKPLLERVCKFFLTLVASKDFLMLDVSEVCALLTSSSIGVNTEIEVLLSAVRWLSFDWNSRKEYSLEVVKCVRFCLFPVWYLVLLNSNAGCAEVQCVVNQEGVKNLILDGLNYRCLTSALQNSNRLELVKELGRHNMELVKKRLVIYDKHCPYHSETQPLKLEFITYKMFKDYLSFIRSADKKHWSTLEVMHDESELVV